MVWYCCAFACKEKYKKGGPITFHSFPKDPERRKLWEIKIRRENFKSTPHTRICIKHFTEDSFDRERFGGTWLKEDAVPSVFDFPAHISPSVRPRKAPKVRVLPSMTDHVPPTKKPEAPEKIPATPANDQGTSQLLFAECTQQEVPIAKKRKRYLGDFDERICVLQPKQERYFPWLSHKERKWEIS